MNKVKLYWSLQIGGWVAFALVQILGFLVLGGQTLNHKQVVFWFLEAGLFLGVTHSFRYYIISRAWLSLSMVRLIPRVIFSVVILGLLVYCLRMLISVPLGMYNPTIAWDVANLVGLTTVYSLILFLWSVSYFIYLYFERYNISLQHEAAMHEIELNHLKSQLNPHFIFNALNSIRALIDEDPKKSKNAVTQLSHILRNSLVTDKKRLTKFEDELKIVQDYLGLESIRFEERLRMSFDIHPDSYLFLVPPLMLQTLVENSIKHGISKLKEGGDVSLHTAVSDGSLKVQIRNSGQLVTNGASGKQKPGLGLKNTKQRLNLIYGEGASLKIRNETKDTVLTELIIPQN